MNAVILTFDRLPARFLGCYGAEGASTPHFDRLAASSVVFDSCCCENTDPQLAAQAWWTGRYAFPTVSGATAGGPGIVSLLDRGGVRTIVLTEAGTPPGAGPRSEVIAVNGRDGLRASPHETPFARLVAAAEPKLQRMADPGSPPSVLWLHSRGVARPWLPPRKFAIDALARAGLLDDDGSASPPRKQGRRDKSERRTHASAGSPSPGIDADLEELDADLETIVAALIDQLDQPGPREPAAVASEFEVFVQTARAVYAGYVTLLDEALGRLVSALERFQAGEPLLFLVTAALGESLGETIGLGQRRSEVEHGSRLTGEITHTPLLLQLLPEAPSHRAHALVQPVDLAPTLLEWFGVAPDGFRPEGQSLLQVARGATGAAREFACMCDGPRRAIRTGDFLLVNDGVPHDTGDPLRADAALPAQSRLYLIPDDRWQVNDVAAQFPEEADRLERQLNELVSVGRHGARAGGSRGDSENAEPVG